MTADRHDGLREPLTALFTSTVVLACTRRWKVALAVAALDVLFRTAFDSVRRQTWEAGRFDRKRLQPAVLWFTGLSGSGKSTIAERVGQILTERGLPVEHLDGDTIRGIFPSTGFTKAERDAHIKRVGYLASRLESHGVFVVVTLVSPYADSRDFVRRLCRNFIEVYVSTPLHECEKRDVKGLYARARRGEIPSFTGIDDPYEPPQHAEVTIDTRQVSVEEACTAVVRRLMQGA